MADKKDFIVRAGLTVSTNASVNTALSVGNSTVNVVINSTAFSGTANNASYLGGNTAFDLQTYADNKAANAYANAVSYTNTNFVNTSNFSSNLANYQTTAGLASNVAGLTANNAAHLGGVNSAIFVQNTDSRTLSGNLVFSGANVVFTTAMYVGANTFANTEGFFVGNSTVNAAIIPGSISINGSVLAGNTYVANTYAPLASPTFTGTVTSANITANNISTNNITTNNGIVTANLTVRSVIANGSLGSAGQVLTTNGANVYWSTVSGGGGGGGGTAYNSIYLQYTGNGTNTVFSIPGGYAANSIGVYINGALLRNGSDVDVTSGSSITFTEAPPNGALIDIIGQSTVYANGVSSVVTQQFTANGTANSFTISGGYLPGTAIVFLNGVKQIPGTDVITTSGTTVNFTSTPANGYIVDVYGYQAAIVQSNSALTVGNTVIGLNQISVGNSSVNTQIVAGNVYLNGSTLVIGNSSSNVVINDNSITIGTQTINSTSISVNATATNTFTIGTGTYFVSNGNVGIGTGSPAARLEVYKSFTDSSLEEIARISRIGGTSTYGSRRSAALTFFDQNNATLTAAVVGVRVSPVGNYNGGLSFYTNGTGALPATSVSQLTERMFIDDSGNVGIGTSSPQARLHINNGAIDEIARFEATSLPYISLYRGGTREFYLLASSVQTGWWGETNKPFIIATNNAERIRITATGDVGIGTTSPGGALGIYRGTGASAMIEVAGNNNTPGVTSMLFGQDGASSGYVWNRANNIILFGTNNTERARITSAGELMVGTTNSSGGKLRVIDGTVDLQIKSGYTIGGGNYCAYLNFGGNNGLAMQAPGTGGIAAIQFFNNNGATGNIVVSGSSTAYNTSSDYRLKENVKPMQNALAKIARLNPVTFDWKTDGKKGQGFIAHELQEVVPDAVSGEKDAVGEDGKPIYQGVDTSFLVATLTKAIQELNAKVDAMQAELDTLRGQ